MKNMTGKISDEGMKEGKQAERKVGRKEKKRKRQKERGN